MLLPSSNSIVRAVPLSPACSRTALRVVMTSAPNRSACLRADVVSSAPETPVGEAREFSIRELRPGCPAVAVHGGGEACGSPADDGEFVHLQRRTRGQAEHRGQLGVGRLDQRLTLL